MLDATADWLPSITAAAAQTDGAAPAAIALAVKYGDLLPMPGKGQTALRWTALAEVASHDLTAARVLEAHSDALAILDEAALPSPGGSWGVFAAESPDVRLDASRDGDRWTLTGTKPWCSLGGQLDHALVTAHVGAGRALFAVDLSEPTVTAEPPDVWVARGLREVPSGPVHFDRTPATAVGGPGWYLTRPGFSFGGIGVAACWYGGAVAVLDAMRTARRRDDDLLALAVGTVDVALHAGAVVLADAARLVDGRRADGADGEVLALRVRSIVAAAAEMALIQAGHLLGPAPMAFDETYARRVADLQIYIRQHHAERDVASLGRRLLDPADRT